MSSAEKQEAAGAENQEIAGSESRRDAGSTLSRISRLSTSEKIKLALLGTHEERMILVRDTNKSVSSAVLKSPKLTDSEIEAISKMRNVSEEVLREIGENRLWLKNYAVALNLVRNPKTPAAISLRLMSRLSNRDLELLSRDRGASEVVRRAAIRARASRRG